jgi:hypothetical protein
MRDMSEIVGIVCKINHLKTIILVNVSYSLLKDLIYGKNLNKSKLIPVAY